MNKHQKNKRILHTTGFSCFFVCRLNVYEINELFSYIDKNGSAGVYSPYIQIIKYTKKRRVRNEVVGEI
ncbi:hypothetical protein ABD73_17465 [Brevibacillus laterosporus]|nr:hypothetical protein [Brevibacillus laterosporus]